MIQRENVLGRGGGGINCLVPWSGQPNIYKVPKLLTSIKADVNNIDDPKEYRLVKKKKS